MIDFTVDIVKQSWSVFGQMAPYLLFGFLAAGVLSVLISPQWVERHLGKPGFGPVLKASLFGVPLPLCSCSVIPVSVSMRRHGASRAAATSFLLSTPQTGVDSIAVTYALLGPVFAVFRPLTALLTGLVGGGLVQWIGEPESENIPESGSAKVAPCSDSCCSEIRPTSRLTRILKYGLVTLPKDIGPALLIGVLIAGIMSALVPQDHLAKYIGGGVASILLMMAAGVPVYVCATASVPIAAGLMHMGGSAGAALAFLIAGPATNAASFTAIWKALGRRTATLYILTVAASALGFGLFLDWLMPIAEISLPKLAGHAHEESGGSWLDNAMAMALLAVFAYSYVSETRLGSGNKSKRENGVATSDSQQSVADSSTTGVDHCCCSDSGGSNGRHTNGD